MSTIIDSLIIELGLDPSKYEAGKKQALESLIQTKKEAARVATEVEESGKQAARFFSQLRATAIELFAAFTAGKGIKEFIADVVTGEAATGRFARQLGLSVENLSAWQGVAERTGGTAAGITSTMQGLTSQIQQFSLTGEAGPAIAYFRSLGIGIADANGHFKTASDLMLELADRVQGLDPVRAAAMVRAATGADPATVSLILRGRDAVQALLEEQKKLGIQTAADAEAGTRLQNSWNALLQSSAKLGRTLLTELEPYITKILDALTRVAEWVQQHPAVLDAVFAGAVVLVTTLTGLLSIGLLGAVGSVGVAIAGMSAPILAVGGAIAAVAAAITLVYEKREQIDKFLNERSPSVKGGLQGALSGALNALVPGAAALPYLSDLFGKPKTGGHGASGSWGGSGAMTEAETEAYIRAAAQKRGIDPDVAVAVAKSEGGLAGRPGDQGSSFGPFQLHYGGIAPGGNAVTGLGDAFTRQTGLNAADASTAREQIDFALDNAKSGGWGPWHGWKGLPFAGLNAPSAGAAASAAGGTTITNDTKIGSITVQTQANDAEGIARSIGPAIERNNLASQANYGNW